MTFEVVLLFFAKGFSNLLRFSIFAILNILDSSCNLSIPLKTSTISFSLLTSTVFFKCDIFFDALMLESDIHSCYLRLWEAISFDNFSCHHRSFCHCCYSLFFSTQYPAKSCGRTKKAPLQISESVLNKFLPCMYASELVHKINDMFSKSLWSINKSTNLWISFLHHVHSNDTAIVQVYYLKKGKFK